jgi:hypothetical protein
MLRVGSGRARNNIRLVEILDEVEVVNIKPILEGQYIWVVQIRNK